MKKTMSILLAMIMVLLMATPSFALTGCLVEKISDFATLKAKLEALGDGQRVQYDILNDIVFTETININAERVVLEFNNMSKSKEAQFIVDGVLGIDVNTYNPNVELYFKDVVFAAQKDDSKRNECGIEISKYSDNCTIDGAKFFYLTNFSSEAAGIYVNAENCTISNCTFDNCSADYGAGIYINNDVVTVENCTFNGCYATSYGGGIYAASYCSDIEITGCTFNKATAKKGLGSCVYGFGEDYVKVIKCSPIGGSWCYYGCEQIDGVGSFISTGSIAVISAVVVLAGIAVFVFIKRKKSNKA